MALSYFRLVKYSHLPRIIVVGDDKTVWGVEPCGIPGSTRQHLSQVSSSSLRLGSWVTIRQAPENRRKFATWDGRPFGYTVLRYIDTYSRYNGIIIGSL